MKYCLHCFATYNSSDWACLHCKKTTPYIDNFISHAPHLIQEGEGFKSNYFAELASLEDTNFWFRARNQIILWAIEKYCKNFNSFLEIGCGTGYVLSGIEKKFPHSKLFGSEIFATGLNFAAQRVTSAELMQMDARHIPFFEEFDTIGAFDVLEHIQEDELVLSKIYRALKKEGYLILTVPQHAWLWSYTDEYACHVRRYSAKDLHTKLKSAGFEIIRSTSFVFFLLPLMLVSRLKKPSSEFDSKKELRIPEKLNRIFYKSMLYELNLMKRGISFPVGGSRLVVARKI